MKTATFIKQMEGWNGDAKLYRMDPPYDSHTHVVVSAVENEYVHETYIFPCNAEGKDVDYMELEGSTRNTTSHSYVLTIIGYDIIKDITP